MGGKAKAPTSLVETKILNDSSLVKGGKPCSSSNPINHFRASKVGQTAKTGPSPGPTLGPEVVLGPESVVGPESGGPGVGPVMAGPGPVFAVTRFL